MQQRNPKVTNISTNFSFLIHKRGPMFRQNGVAERYRLI